MTWLTDTAINPGAAEHLRAWLTFLRGDPAFNHFECPPVEPDRAPPQAPAPRPTAAEFLADGTLITWATGTLEDTAPPGLLHVFDYLDPRESRCLFAPSRCFAVTASVLRRDSVGFSVFALRRTTSGMLRGDSVSFLWCG
jgi:hypothetical protein